MAVREFNGTSDKIIASAGGLSAFPNGAFMIFAVVKYTTIGGPEGIVSLQNTSSTCLGSLADTGGGNLSFYSNAATPGVWEDIQANAWYLLAITKASGTSTPRAHATPLSSIAWSHDDMSGTVADVATAVTSIQFGALDIFGSSNYKDCRIATIGLFTFSGSPPNDATIEGITSTQDLADLAALASEVYDLNQASTGTAVDSLTGTSTQSSISGTTVVTDDDPPNWTFGVVGSGSGSGSGSEPITVDLGNALEDDGANPLHRVKVVHL